MLRKNDVGFNRKTNITRNKYKVNHWLYVWRVACDSLSLSAGRNDLRIIVTYLFTLNPQERYLYFTLTVQEIHFV